MSGVRHVSLSNTETCVRFNFLFSQIFTGVNVSCRVCVWKMITEAIKSEFSVTNPQIVIFMHVYSSTFSQDIDCFTKLINIKYYLQICIHYKDMVNQIMELKFYGWIAKTIHGERFYK